MTDKKTEVGKLLNAMADKLSNAVKVEKNYERHELVALYKEYCTPELQALANINPDFKAMGYMVAAVAGIPQAIKEIREEKKCSTQQK